MARLEGKKSVTPPAGESYRDGLIERLRKPAYAAGYLEAILEDGDPHVLVTALRDVVEAHGGMTMLARKTGLSREALYRTLSPKGNPRYDTLSAVLAAFGLRLSIQPLKAA